MESKYCFEISFPSIDLDSYYPNSDKCQETQHAHLFIKENEIEIRIFYCYSMHLDRKINSVLEKDWKGFCSTIKSKVDDSENKDLLKIDFSESTVLSTNSGTTQKENDFHYLSIYINQVTLSWQPFKSRQNSAEFYLTADAIQIVEQFYTIYSEFANDSMNRIERNEESFYQLGYSEFRLELDVKESRKAKIHFNYKKEVGETDALKYAEIVCLLCSFYTRTQINYSIAQIHLADKTITINKILPPQLATNQTRYVFHALLSSNLKNEWQGAMIDNFDKLKKAVEKFNQSLIVSGSSQFLLRYNIIEICKDGKKEIDEEFKYDVSKKKKTKRYNEALKLLLEIILSDEKEEFKRKWDSARKGILKYRVMLGPLKKFLELNSLDIEKFPISVERINTIRDSLTHGNDEIETKELDEANNQLYWIAVVLIANLMGLTKMVDSNKYVKLKS